jgi:hypothetical protein
MPQGVTLVGRAGRWMVAFLVAAAAFAVATWASEVFLFTRWLPSPDARWPVAAVVGAAAAAFAGLWGQSWATGIGNADRAAGQSLAGIADGLAGRLRSQWEREAKVRRLNDPYPLPVSWAAADAPLAGDLAALKTLAVSGAGWSAPARDDWAQRPEDLAGKGRELVDVLARVPTGRLVVLGEPGAGKTMLMVRLMLDLLARRADGGPVPVLAPAASWNPEKRDLHGWLADMLITGYPDLDLPPPPGSAGRNRFEALVAAGLILPVLDGLDEISESSKAIKRINEELRPGEQVVVTCRTEHYRAAVSPQGGQGVALRAAAVQLSTLEFGEVASYLRKDAGPAAGRWDFLDALGAGSPVRQALATPLMAGLARAIYNPRPGELAGTLPDPAELCNPDRRAVESRLFDAFIPAAYRHDPDGRWKAQDAEKWLVFLARHLEREIAGPDLAWWQLRRSMPRTAVGTVVVVAAVAGVVTGVVVGLGLAAGLVAGGVLAVGFEVVLGIGAGIGVAVPLVAGLVGRSSAKAPARGVRIRAGVGVLAALLVGRRRAEAPVLGVGVRSAWLWAGIVVGVVIVAEGVAGAGSAAQAVLNVAFVVALVVVVAAVAGLEGVPGDLEEAASPRAVLARDRRAALLLMLAAGVAAGYLVGVMAGARAGAAAGIAAVAGAGVGVGLSARQTAWPSYLLTIGWLALSRRLPRSLMGFLADAHQRGVLRQAGAVYQFRHIDLQHRLATRP